MFLLAARCPLPFLQEEPIYGLYRQFNPNPICRRYQAELPRYIFHS